MSLFTRIQDDVLEIQVNGRFTFDLHSQFRSAYRHTDGPKMHYVVNLSAVDYLDSSALGMLLLLREHGGRQGRNVTLKGARNGVGRLLELARFDKLFETL